MDSDGSEIKIKNKKSKNQNEMVLQRFCKKKQTGNVKFLLPKNYITSKEYEKTIKQKLKETQKDDRIKIYFTKRLASILYIKRK